MKNEARIQPKTHFETNHDRKNEEAVSHDSTESAHVSSVPHDQHSSLEKFPTNNKKKKEGPPNSNILETTETTEEERMLSNSEFRQQQQLGSGLNPQVLDVNVSVPVAAPVSVTLDSFAGQAQMPMPTMDNDNANANNRNTVNAMHTMNTVNTVNAHSHSLTRHDHNHDNHDLNLNSMHGVSVLAPVPDNLIGLDHNCDHHQVTGRTMIDIDQHSQPPTPQFDSNATQMEDFQGHQVHVNVEMNGHGHGHGIGDQAHGFSHNPTMDHEHETMVPIQQATGHIESEMNRSVHETVNDVIEHFSETEVGGATARGHHAYQGDEMEVHGNEDDNEHENDDENDDDDANNNSDDESEVNAEDTLEILKATPLAITPEDFENKFPAHMAQAPANPTPIEHPNPSDILFGRGGLTNHHEGNKVYRTIVDSHKPDYQNAAKIVKPRVARRIVHAIRHSNLGARFLRKDPTTDMWQDVGDKIASEKTSQALREKSPEEKKRASQEKAKEDNVAVGISMPNMRMMNDGMLVLAAVGINAGNDSIDLSSAIVPAPAVVALAPVNLLHATQGAVNLTTMAGHIVSSTGASRNADVQHTIMTYPVEGGTFGTVNVGGQIVITERDILCGRGGATNHHPGNKRFRDLVAVHRPDYVAAPKVSKPVVARRLVRAIRMANPPGRFLKKRNNGLWEDIGDKKAAEKCSQALREKGPEDKQSQKERNERDEVQVVFHPEVPVAAPITISTHIGVENQAVFHPEPRGVLDNSELDITSPDLKRLKRCEDSDEGTNASGSSTIVEI